jgi:hypothetical protein
MGEFDLDVVLSPDRATVRRQTDQPLTTDRRLLHSWDNVPKGAKDEIKSKFFADRKYTNPRIGGIDYTGTWRVSSVDFEENGNGVVAIRELRLGFLTTLISNSAIDWSESRLAGSTSVTLTERRLIVQWENVDPKKLESIKLELLSDAFLVLGQNEEGVGANISVGGESLNGEWNRVSVETSRAQEDGAGVVTMVLSLGERTETVTRQDGTLKPITDVEYFGVPQNRVSDVLPALLDAEQVKDAAGEFSEDTDLDSKRTNVSTRISYSAGLANITISTTNIKEAKTTQTIEISANEQEVTELRWNKTLKEIEEEIENLGLDKYEDPIIRDKDGKILTNKTSTCGVMKSLVQTSNGDKTWDMTARVRTVDTLDANDVPRDSKLTSKFDVVDIDAPELVRRDPEVEAEVRRYRWFHIHSDAIVEIREKLESAPVGWEVLDISEDHNVEIDTYHLTWTIEYSGSKEWTVQKDQEDAELEVRTIQYLNRPVWDDEGNILEPPEPDLKKEEEEKGELKGYVVTSLQINDPDRSHADYIYRLEKEGTQDNQVVIANTGKEAARIRLELLKRSEAPKPALSEEEVAEGAPEVDNAIPSIEGYVLVGEEKRNAGDKLVDYIYNFQFEGTKTWTTQYQQVAAEVELQTVELLNRDTTKNPPEDPTVAGYSLMTKVIEDIDGNVSNYRYQFQKIGTKALEVRKAFPPSQHGPPRYRLPRDAESITETHFSRTEPPDASDPEVIVKPGYTLMDVLTRNREGVLADYTYMYEKTSDGKERYIGITTPYFLARWLYVEKNVLDGNLSDRIDYFSDNENWDDHVIVDSVSPRYNGSGLTDLYITVIALPKPYVNYTTSIDEYDGPFKANAYKLITDKAKLYPKKYDISASKKSATVSEYAVKTGLNEAVPTGGKTGRQLRERNIIETVTFSRDRPSVKGMIAASQAASGPFKFEDYTYESRKRNEQVGYWVHRNVRVITGDWENEGPKISSIPTI